MARAVRRVRRRDRFSGAGELLAAFEEARPGRRRQRAQQEMYDVSTVVDGARWVA